MRHLDVINRILFRLGCREIDIEDQLRITLAHQKEVPHRVPTNFVHEVANGHVTAGALGDLHFFAVLHHRHHLVQHVLGISAGHSHVERLEPGPNPGDGAVMVGALDVDRALESTFPFRHVVGDVRHEIRVGAVTLAHDAILVVAEVGRAQPQRSFVLVGLP